MNAFCPSRVGRGGRLGFISLSLVLALSAFGTNCAKEERPPNFVLVTLDTTRPDHLGPYGYAGAQTPNLDRFAASSRVYERAYATSSRTLASHASILTGLFPGEHGARLGAQLFRTVVDIDRIIGRGAG